MCNCIRTDLGNRNRQNSQQRTGAGNACPYPAMYWQLNMASWQVANSISILYGGSVKAANAKEIFGQPDVDGGLVGGSSLIAAEFATIINSLK